MEKPFFTDGRWYQQQPRRYPFSPTHSYGGVPAHHLDPLETRLASRQPVQRQPERGKVVRVPVQFVGSGQVDRLGSAVKIQKVFRGFLVRKCLKKIKDIKCKVDEIEGRLSEEKVVDLVRRDEKERLRMNESLMSLLFKLDSICGVDFGVRACRKAVIRKAIALQERIDAIVAVNFTGNCEAVDQEDESGGGVVSEEILKPEDSPESAVLGENNNEMEILGNNDIIDVGVDREVKVISESNPVGFDNGCVCEKSDFSVENGTQEKAKEGHKVEDDDKRNRDLLERMIEDNEKMMSMMKQLFERNEMQSRMINTLTNRVDMLEKAFVCDVKFRKKKKKKAAGAGANTCSDH
ncbi:BAG family molecular chaperone regulator 5-mitochondrial [Striga hermonthica]|uniref:BAG family molecular chaperone regulator 5-mitochondrial n=1 Tax=Striga hermonthica TaxID=68872 RepID=A0A9N7MK11_STRHE|nr:BAG family molecular chaperone regulator 5-mitochondrial [Striga hermonthica]